MGESLRHGQPVGLGKGIAAHRDGAAAFGFRHLRRQPHQRQAVRDHRVIVFARPVPFQHGEFRRMQPPAFPVAEDAGEIEDFVSPAASSFLAANSGEVCR